MMVEKTNTENEEEEKEEESLSPEELELLNLPPIRVEEAADFPPELIVESEQEYTEEQRQNLYQKILKMTIPEKIRLAMLGNREARNFLIHDRNKIISAAVLRSPKMSNSEILNFAQQKNTPDDVVLTISKNRVWMRNYYIKLAIVSNPKTPLSVAIKFLDHLHDKDLQTIYRSKNVPSVLAQAAGRILFKRKR
jgi:hypothetical protein